MFDLCRRNSKSAFNYYVSYELHETDFAVKRTFPEDVPKSYLVRILEFGFFCCSDRKPGERFVLVFTDADGSLEFVYCYRPAEKFVFCISSSLPWFACFHGILDILWFNELHRDSRWYILQSWLTRLLAAQPPTEPINYFMCPDPFRSHRHVKFKIPNSFSPHNPKYMMEYYNALDFSLWIHIFVRLILERSVLFYSARLPRLTSCVLTAVSLLHPLQWAHSLYPVIPHKLIEVLGCPAPFVAGIHSCNLQAALEHVSPDTCLVNLDAGTVEFPPTSGYSTEDPAVLTLTPKAVFDYLRRLLKDARRQFTAAFNRKNPKSFEWKKVDGEACSFFEQLANPFFCLLLNLFGGYKECLVSDGDSPEVSIDLLVAQQNCPDLEPFLYSLCDTQAVQLFLDSLVCHHPDHSTDAFESACRELYSPTGKRKLDRKTHRSAQSPRVTKPLPLAEVVNGSATNPSDRHIDQSFVRTGLKQWAQSKKIRCPGELCSWDYDNNFTDSKSTRSLASSSFTNLNQKFLQLRSQAATLKNLSRTKDTPTTDRSHVPTTSVDDTLIRSRSSSTLPNSTRLYSILDRSSTTRLHELVPGSCETLENATDRTNRAQTQEDWDSCQPHVKRRPPRPPPPRVALRTFSLQQPVIRSASKSVNDRPLTVPSLSQSSHIPIGIAECSPVQSPPIIHEQISHRFEAERLRPPPLPPRPAWLLSREKTISGFNKPLLRSRVPDESGPSKPRNSATLDNSRVSRSCNAQHQPTYRPCASTALARPVSQIFPTSPPFDPMAFSPTGGLYLRRRSRLTNSSFTLESSQASLRCSDIQRHSSKGDSSTMSRTSSGSHESTPAEATNNPRENERQKRWLPIGDAETPWLSDNTKPKTNGVPCGSKPMPRRCATFSHTLAPPKYVGTDTKKTGSCKSLNEL